MIKINQLPSGRASRDRCLEAATRYLSGRIILILHREARSHKIQREAMNPYSWWFHAPTGQLRVPRYPCCIWLHDPIGKYYCKNTRNEKSEKRARNRSK
jgi:hypothetical protein